MPPCSARSTRNRARRAAYWERLGAAEATPTPAVAEEFFDAVWSDRFGGLSLPRMLPLLDKASGHPSRKSPVSGAFLHGPGWDRTNDLGIKSPLLYRLSYRPAVEPV